MSLPKMPGGSRGIDCLQEILYAWETRGWPASHTAVGQFLLHDFARSQNSPEHIYKEARLEIHGGLESVNDHGNTIFL